MPAFTKFGHATMLVLAVAPATVRAGTLDYSLYAGIQHSNNITLSSNNPISQNELIPGVDFVYLQQGSVLQANVIGMLEYHDYPGNKFDSQTQTQLAAQLNWSVLPQRLDFSVEDYAGVQPIDSLTSNAPDNQQQTNVLSVGPTLHLQLGNALSGQAELRYMNSYASKADDFNSSRGMAAFRLFHEISPTDQLSANIQTERVTFDNSGGGSNYNRNEVYAGYTTRLSKFDAEAVLGWSQLNFDHSPSDSAPLARLTLDWRPTLSSTFAVTGTSQYADAAQDMMLSPQQAGGNMTETLNGAIGGVMVGNSVIDSQVYLEKTVETSYAFSSERLTLTISPIYRKLHYLNDPTFDQRGLGGSFNLSYRLRPALTLTTFATAERLTYQTLDRRDRTARYGVDLSLERTSHWRWHASLIRQQRNSNATDQSYRETEIFFGVVFRR